MVLCFFAVSLQGREAGEQECLGFFFNDDIRLGRGLTNDVNRAELS